MVYNINSDVIRQNNLTVNEFLILLVKANGIRINEIDSLVEKCLLFKDGSLTKEGIELFDKVIFESSNDLPKQDEVELIAEAMKDIYPTGKKPGTSYYWTDSVKLISRRLLAFFKKYGQYSKDDILEATRAYVKKFEYDPDRRLMRLLKYFIYKEGRDSDGTTTYDSELLNIMEHKGEQDNEPRSFDFSRTIWN